VHDTDEPADRVAELERELTGLAQRVARLEHPAPGSRRGVRAPLTSESGAQLEATLGTYWLSRIGILSLITGTALLILTYFEALGPVLRVALGYLIAAGLAWAGRRIARHHAKFGNVIFGGGLAIAYFVTYALHFVPRMQIIESEPLGILLVAVAIAGIVITAHRLQSETVAGLALFLGLHTGMLTDVSALTLVCTTMLAAGAVFFLAANRWVIVPLSGVVAVYSTHATWAFGAGSAASPQLSLGFLGVDFVLFASASLLRPDVKTRSLVVLSLLNWAGMVALGGYELRDLSREALFGFFAAIAIAQVALAMLARLRRAPRSFVALQLALGIVTLAMALPVWFHGWTLFATWSALGLIAGVTSRRTEAPAFGWIALVILGCALGQAQHDHLGVVAPLITALGFLAVEQLQPARIAPAFSMLRICLGIGVAVGLVEAASIAVPAGLATLGWVAAASLLFTGGFVVRTSLYRWAAFGVLGVSAVRVLGVDLRHLSADQRILTFVGAGVLMLIISFAYTRRRARAGGS
jgi:hypothetical protein